MLPVEVANNRHIKRWSAMPKTETDGRHIVEAWERKPHPDDIPARYSGSAIIPGEYYGEWQNVTARDKQAWEVEMAKNELERLKREERRKSIEAVELGRSSLDGPIGVGRRHS